MRIPVVDDTPPTIAPLEAALSYAARGWPVFPLWSVRDGVCACGDPACNDEGKHPIGGLVEHGLHDATTDAAIIRGWYDAVPGANVAIVTGVRSGIDGLDIDDLGATVALEAQMGRLPRAPMVRTGRGVHLLFAHHDGVRNRTDLDGFAGLDVRGEGGYLVAPPSRHRTGAWYRWLSDALIPAPPWPPALLELVLAPRRRTNGPALDDDDEDDVIREGARNDTLTRLAGAMRRHGAGEGTIRAALRAENARRCRPPLPEREVDQIAASVGRYAPAAQPAAEPWPHPQPIPTALRPVPVFDPVMLSDVFARWIGDVAERFQCPPEFVAIPAVITAASLIGRKVAIRPKRVDDWTVVANLWGIIVARPGEMKSPAMDEALKPLRQLIPEARLAHERAMVEHTVRVAEEKARRRRLEEELRAAYDHRAEHRPLEAIREDLRSLPLVAPAERRYLVNDPTVEKLGELLNQNANGLLLSRDEIGGWLNAMDRQGHENDRAFYCECWTGTNPYTYDRIGRGTLHIDACCLSIVGGIQPGPLRHYLREVFTTGGGDDGLIQRFQLAVFPDRHPWELIDRGPDLAARTRVMDVFRRLDGLTASAVGAEQLVPNELPYLRFAPDAQDVFDQWLTQLERRREAADDEHPAVVSHFAKYRSLMPSLALIFHLLDVVDSRTRGPVSLCAAERAVAWCLFLDAHARRIYQSITAREEIAAALLARKITRGRLTNPFTKRDVCRFEWSGLSTPEDVDPGLGLLEELGWLRREDVRPAAGRPTVRFWINPAITQVVTPVVDEEAQDEA